MKIPSFKNETKAELLGQGAKPQKRISLHDASHKGEIFFTSLEFFLLYVNLTPYLSDAFQEQEI